MSAFDHLSTYHPYYSTLLFIIWDSLMTCTLLLLWCTVMGNRGVGFLAVPTHAMINPNATDPVHSTHMLMNYKYFNIFLILIVVVDLFILCCVITIISCILQRCCTFHCPRRTRKGDMSVHFRNKQSSSNHDETVELKPIPLYPSVLGLRDKSRHAAVV